MGTPFDTYRTQWRAIFPRRRALSWRQGWLANAYCRDCRYCCGPQDSNEPFPMALLPRQTHPHLDQDFYLLDGHTAFLDARGCKSCTDRGCRLPRPRRPVACGLFPLVLTRSGLYLYQICPAALFTPLDRWLELGREAARWLEGLPDADRARIAIALPAATLADRYINLHISPGA